MVIFCDFVFDTKKAIIRNSLRKQDEGKELEESYQRYLDQFKYKYPKTYEDYSGGRGDLVEAYESVYLPRFY